MNSRRFTRSPRRLQNAADTHGRQARMTESSTILRLAVPRVAAIGCLLASAVSVAFGQASEDFYRGRQISLIINSAAGGGYDVYARSFARYFGRHIPGNPLIVARNLPGAGGILAANALYANSDSDGLTLGALANTAVFDSIRCWALPASSTTRAS
jgi:hypothetical protein